MPSDVPGGFKASAVGTIPVSWKVEPVEALFSLQLGKMLSPAAKSGVGSAPYLRNENVQWGSFRLESLYEMDFDEDERSKFSLHDGDIVMCEGGEVGRCAIWRGQVSGCYFQKALHRLRPLSPLSVLPEFMYAFVEHHFRGTASPFVDSGQTTFAHLTREKLARIPVAVPPLPEQRKIAAILSSVDEAIQATQAVIDQTRRVKEGLLQDLLTRGIGHTRFKQTEIGEIPESWDVVLLDTVAERGSGHTPDKKHPEYWNGDIWWVSLADSHRLDAVFVSETTSKITPLGIANSSAVLHPEGTVFVSRDASVGRSAIAAVPLAVSQHFIAWRCGPSLNNLFLYYLLQKHKRRFEQIAAGSTIKTIGLGYFKAFRIPLPAIVEQDRIATTLFALDQAMWGHEQHLSLVQRVKAGLLQDLLTGRVRVAA